MLDEEMISQDFLMAAKKFMPELSTNWVVSKHASKQKLEFYETVKEFQRSLRLSELSQLGNTHPSTLSTATLQEQSESSPGSNI